MSEVPQHVPDAERTKKPPRNPREKELPDTDTGGGPLMPTAIEQAMEPAEFAELPDISDEEFERQLEHAEKQLMSEVADDSMQRQAIRDVQARHDMRDPSTAELRQQQHEVGAKLEAIKAVRIAERAKQEALQRTIEGDAFTAKEMEAIPQTFDRLDPQRILLYTEVAKELGYQDSTDIEGVHRSYEAMQRSVQDLRLANPKDPKAAQIASLLPRSWQDFLGANPPSPPTGLRGLFKRVSGLFRKAELTPRQAMLKNILEASHLMNMGATGRTEMRGSAVGAAERTPSLGGMGEMRSLEPSPRENRIENASDREALPNDLQPDWRWDPIVGGNLQNMDLLKVNLEAASTGPRKQTVDMQKMEPINQREALQMRIDKRIEELNRDYRQALEQFFNRVDLAQNDWNGLKDYKVMFQKNLDKITTSKISIPIAERLIQQFRLALNLKEALDPIRPEAWPRFEQFILAAGSGDKKQFDRVMDAYAKVMEELGGKGAGLYAAKRVAGVEKKLTL